MKQISRLLKLFFIILTFTILSQSCKKEDTNTAPVVKVLNLDESKLYLPGDEILVKVDASDKEGELKEVQLYINNNLISTVTTAPYDIIWKTWGNPLGNYAVKAVAVDKAGKSSENTVNIKLKKGAISNGNLYDLDIGYVTYQGVATPSSYSLDISLYSKSVINTNYGNGFKIKCFSAEKTLINGTYNFDSSSAKSLNTFNFADYFINCDKDNRIGGVSAKVNQGYIYVSKVGTVYKFFLNGKDELKNTIRAYFEGDVIIEDNTVK